jgi:hypothetical protein
LLHLPFYYVTEVDWVMKIDHQIGGEVLLTSPVSGTIHNKNQDSLCRSACTAFFLLCCHESLLYNWKLCKFVTTSYVTISTSCSCWDVFGLGSGRGGEVPISYIISLIAPGTLWYLTLHKKSKRTLVMIPE